MSALSCPQEFVPLLPAQKQALIGCHPIKGFEKGRAVVVFIGQPKEVVILGERSRYSKVFEAFVEDEEGWQEIGRIQIQRYRTRKKDGLYGSENCQDGSFLTYGRERGRRVSKIFVDIIQSPQNARYKGVGTALMQAVMEYGFSKGCEGRIDLDACWSSHLFYHKLGMIPVFEKKEAAIAKFVAQQGIPDTSRLGSVTMFMPEERIVEWRKRIQANPILQLVWV
jgi:hypothetical protein